MASVKILQEPQGDPVKSPTPPCIVANSFRPCFFDFREDQRGTIAITFALSITVLFGFLALATDAASWMTDQRAMQGAADAAAYSASVAYSKNDGTTIVTQAKAIAAQMGYVDGQNGVTVSVHQPPTSGNYTSVATAIQVIITKQATQFFAGRLDQLPSDASIWGWCYRCALRQCRR